MAKNKQYGLIIPKKKLLAPGGITRPSVFGDDSSDEDENVQRKIVGASLKKEGIKKLEAKVTKDTLTKALQQDPTVFDYDGVYDEMQRQKEATTAKSKAKKETKSKYIHSLKRSAEMRNLEIELALERKVQKEREAEGEEFSDKEAFVTGAYKRRLEERAQLEEKLRIEAEIEKKNDVTKQNDLSRIYRHLLDKKTSQATTNDEAAPTPTLMQDGIQASGTNSSSRTETAPSSKERTSHISLEEQAVVSEGGIADETVDKEQDNSKEEMVHNEAIQNENEAMQNENEAVQNENEAIHDEGVVEPQETLEERRKRLFSKRTSDQAATSAKERYLARKRAKMSEPVIAKDD